MFHHDRSIPDGGGKKPKDIPENRNSGMFAKFANIPESTKGNFSSKIQSF